jgi:hypothetical protein
VASCVWMLCVSLPCLLPAACLLFAVSKSAMQ